MSKPRPTDRTRLAAKSIRATGAGRELESYIQQLIEHEKELLVTSLPEGVRSHQGRISAFREVLSVLTTE